MSDIELLTAVDALTKPETRHMAQKTDAGAWIRIARIAHDPLLKQMHDAVWPSSNCDAGSASLKGQRSPADLEAMYEFAKMQSAINSWCWMVNVRPTRDPVTDLRRWYVAFTRQRDADAPWHARELRKWQAKIRRHLDPPAQFEADGGCPVCGATSWGDQLIGGTRPIVIEYKIDDETQNTEDHVALCRACRTVWEGYDAVMELGDELKEKRDTPTVA